jgi:hypothetical protein
VHSQLMLQKCTHWLLSVSLSTCLCYNLRRMEQILIKFYAGCFVNIFQFWLKPYNSNKHFTWRSICLWAWKWLGEEFTGYLNYHGYLGNSLAPMQPHGGVLFDDGPARQYQTPHPHGGHWPKTAGIIGTIHKFQILADTPQLLCCAYISTLV